MFHPEFPPFNMESKSATSNPRIRAQKPILGLQNRPGTPAEQKMPRNMDNSFNLTTKPATNTQILGFHVEAGKKTQKPPSTRPKNRSAATTRGMSRPAAFTEPAPRSFTKTAEK